MNKFLKLSGLILPLFLTVGCGNETTNQNTSSTAISSQSSVDGYKSFKFGMKASELSKLPECANQNYEDSIKLKLDELETKRIGLEKEVSEPSPFTGNMRAEYEADIKNQTAKLSDEINDIRANPEKHLIPLLECNITFAGQNIVLRRGESELGSTLGLLLNSGVMEFNEQFMLKKVSLPIGAFNQDKLDSVLKDLESKYPASSRPNDADIAKVNNEIGTSTSWFFAGNAVQLQVSSYQNGKYIVVHYNDPSASQDAMNSSQRGKVNSNDL